MPHCLLTWVGVVYQMPWWQVKKLGVMLHAFSLPACSHVPKSSLLPPESLDGLAGLFFSSLSPPAAVLSQQWREVSFHAFLGCLGGCLLF